MSASNPFSANKIRPGTLPFVVQHDTVEDIASRLERFGGRGQIVGPHGTGKTTLMLALVRHLSDLGTHVSIVRLPARNDASFPQKTRGLLQTVSASKNGVLAVDGWDQLALVTRMKVHMCLRARNTGLLVTMHRRGLLPILTRTAVTISLASKIVTTLLENAGLSDSERRGWQLQRSADLAELLTKHHGNLREVLFELYDRYEEWLPSVVRDAADSDRQSPQLSGHPVHLGS